jgi:hypothetical protein
VRGKPSMRKPLLAMSYELPSRPVSTWLGLGLALALALTLTRRVGQPAREHLERELVRY